MSFIEIPLTRGKVALIDSADLPLIAGLKFSAHKSGTNSRDVFYAKAWMGSSPKSLHRLLMGAQPGQMVDHRNGDGLDCRRANLRFATKSENGANTEWPIGACGFRGVHKRVKNGWLGYRAAVVAQGKRYTKGPYSTALKAAHAYDALARLHHGEFARLNFPEAA